MNERNVFGEGDEGDTVGGAEEFLRNPRLPSLNTDISLPNGVEYPLSFKVRDFITNQGFLLADGLGRRTNGNVETTYFGLLLQNELSPSRYPWVRFFRKFVKPPARWVGIIHFDEKYDDGWLVRAFGINNAEPLKEFAKSVSSEFSKNIIPVRLSDEVERSEQNLFGIPLSFR
jgi:hypothetical protein